MKKKEMAIFIADTTFGKNLSGDPSVGPDNWLVRDLMRRTKADLAEVYEMAICVRRGSANAHTLGEM